MTIPINFEYMDLEDMLFVLQYRINDREHKIREEPESELMQARRKEVTAQNKSIALTAQ